MTAESVAEVLIRLARQHRRVEVVDQDGDDWTGCLCGEPDDRCAVLALIEETAE